jgi:hypothetical protein
MGPIETASLCLRTPTIILTGFIRPIKQGMYRNGGEEKCICIIGGKARRKMSHLGKPRSRLVNNIKMEFPEGRGFDTRSGEFLNLPNPSGRTKPCGLLNL